MKPVKMAMKKHFKDAKYHNFHQHVSQSLGLLPLLYLLLLFGMKKEKSSGLSQLSY